MGQWSKLLHVTLFSHFHPSAHFKEHVILQRKDQSDKIEKQFLVRGNITDNGNSRAYQQESGCQQKQFGVWVQT